MKPPAEVLRGVRVLRHLLQQQTLDLRHLDLAGFRAWLDHQRSRWQNDTVFVQRSRIRDLRRAHPGLHSLVKEHHRAVLADAASPAFLRLQQLEQELRGATQAVAGLSAALKRTTGEKRAALREKLRAFGAKRRALQQERARLVRSSPERQRVLALARKLHRLRATIGLDREETALDQLLRQQGRRFNRSGHSFEQLALALTQDRIVPDLLRSKDSPEVLGRVRVLHGVRLGAARTEFDQLIVRLPRDCHRPVDVLAVVEVKRNLNDLAHGFRRRQENLAWLTGDTEEYDPSLYRTRYFRHGHFDRPAAHHQDGETYRFDRSSFRRFHRDPATGQRLDRFFLIAQAGPLWGVSAAVLARIGHRIATDERWQPDSEAYLRNLLAWCQGLAEPLETPDVLRLYAVTPKRARRVLLVGRQAERASDRARCRAGILD